jgi:hypothetical protein
MEPALRADCMLQLRPATKPAVVEKVLSQFNPALHLTGIGTICVSIKSGSRRVHAAISAAINPPFRYPAAINSPSRPHAMSM